MFTWRHYVWLAICACGMSAVLIAYFKKRPPLKKVLTTAVIISVLSELCKMISVIKLVPSSGGELLLPYLPLNHLPLHFCSIQILLILYTRFTRSEKKREYILAFMYPTCILGAIAALLMPSIFTTSISVEQAFTSLLSYQFFIFHTMLVTLGVIIAGSGEIKWSKKHLKITLGLIYAMGIASIYLNSLLASPTYKDGELVSVDFWTNFFFTYQNPIGIKLTEIWQWYVYLAVLAVLAAVLVSALYLPLLGKKRSGSAEQDG